MPMSRTAKASMRQGGFSIVEMMVAIVISLLILAGVSVLLVGVLKNRNELEKSNRQIDNGRYALEILSEDLRLAGYFGLKAFDGDDSAGALPAICVPNVAAWTNQFHWAVQGYDDKTAFPETECLSSGAPPIYLGLEGGGTDILVVRRQSADSVAADGVTANQPYIQTGTDYSDRTTVQYKYGLGGVAVFDLERMSGTDYGIAEVYRLLTHVYFIAPCSRGTGANGICVSGDDGIPTLKRLELTGGPAFNLVSIAEGIEDINYEYGLDSDGDGSPDSYTAEPGVLDWKNVVSVRIYVLARNIDASDAGSEQKTFNMGLGKDSLTTTQTQFKRHVFTQTVRINNVSMRRE